MKRLTTSQRINAVSLVLLCVILILSASLAVTLAMFSDIGSFNGDKVINFGVVEINDQEFSYNSISSLQDYYPGTNFVATGGIKSKSTGNFYAYVEPKVVLQKNSEDGWFDLDLDNLYVAKQNSDGTWAATSTKVFTYNYTINGIKDFETEEYVPNEGWVKQTVLLKDLENPTEADYEDGLYLVNVNDCARISNGVLEPTTQADFEHTFYLTFNVSFNLETENAVYLKLANNQYSLITLSSRELANDYRFIFSINYRAMQEANVLAEGEVPAKIANVFNADENWTNASSVNLNTVDIKDIYEFLSVSEIFNGDYNSELYTQNLWTFDGTSISPTAECLALTSVTVPGYYMVTDINSVEYGKWKQVKTIGEKAFNPTVDYNAANVESTTPNTTLQSVTISEGIETVGAGAFAFCTSLTSVTFPDSLRNLNSYAFRFCTSLSTANPNIGLSAINASAFEHTVIPTFNMPDSILYLGSNAFFYNVELQNVTFSKNLTTINNGTFQMCTKLDNVVVPENITSLGSSAFHNCYLLTNITLPSALNSLGASTFYSCLNLQTITIPNSVTSIGTNCFADCRKLATLNIPFVSGSRSSTDTFGYLFGNVASTGDSITQNGNTYRVPSTLKTINITNATQIPTYAFQNMNKVTSLTINNSLQSMSANVFLGCSSLATISVPFVGLNKTDTTNTFGYLFGNDASTGDSITQNSNYYRVPNTLTTINITNATQMPAYSFQNMAKVQSISVPSTVATIGTNAFDECLSLIEINVDANSASFSSTDGVLFNKSKTVLIKYPVSKLGTSYSIPSSVITIYGRAFMRCKYLTEVIIPNTVNSIYSSAFSNMPELLTITIPSSVNSLGTYVFYQCSKMQTAILNCNVTSLPQSFFGSCINLTSATLPNSINTISSYSFRNCNKLPSITFPTSLTTIQTEAFYNCALLNNLSFPTTLTTIGDSAFYNCGSINSLSFPTSLTTIGATVLTGCSNLATISVPFVGSNIADTTNTFGYLFGNVASTGDSITQNGNTYCVPNLLTTINVLSATQIPNYSFQNMNKLTTISIGSAVESISADILSGCSSLATVSVPFFGLSGADTTNTFGYLFGNVTSTGDSITQNGNTYRVPSTLKTINITSATQIPQYAFQNMNKVTTINIGNTVESISADILSGCSTLATLSIPFVGLDRTDVTNTFGILFGTTSFTGAIARTQLTNVYYIPSSLKTVNITNASQIRSNAFEQCRDVRTFDLTGSTFELLSNNIFNLCYETLNFILPNTLKTIDHHAFVNCMHMSSIVLPESLQTINYNAFQNCGALTSIYIPKNVSSIHPDAFLGNKLTTITVDSLNATYSSPTGSNCIMEIATKKLIRGCNSTVIPTSSDICTIIGTSAFDYQTLTSIFIPKNIEVIQNYAFSCTYYLTNCTFEANSNLTTLGYGVFQSARTLPSIILPDSLQTIGQNLFYDCRALQAVTVPFIGLNRTSTSPIGWWFGNGYSDSTIRYDAIQNSVTYHIPNTLTTINVTNATKIAQYAFQNLTSVTTINIESVSSTISEKSFTGCTGLINLTLPFVGTNISATGETLGIVFDTVEYGVGGNTYSAVQGSNTYYLPTSLTNISIIGATNMPTKSFQNMKYVTTILISNSVQTMEAGLFAGCDALDYLTIPFSSTSRTGTDYFGYIVGLTTRTSAAEVCITQGANTETYPDRTYYMPTIANINLTDVTQIQPYAFRNLTYVNNVTITTTAESYVIMSNAFEYCLNLNSITIDKCSQLAAYAIYRTNLPSIHIPASCTNINSLALYQSYYLEHITVDDNNTVYADYDCDCIVVKSTKTMLKGSLYTDLASLGSNCTIIGTYCFAGLKNLTSVTIPDSITLLNYWSFNCPDLVSIDLGTNVSLNLADDFCMGCNYLTTISITSNRYVVKDGCLVDTSNGKIILLAKNYVIPATVSLNSITYDVCDLASGLFRDKHSAFAATADLDLPANITKVTGGYVFSWGGMLSNKTIIFRCNSQMTFGNNVFNGTYATGIKFYSTTVPTTTASTFAGYTNKTIYVPTGYKTTYETAWSSVLTSNNITITEFTP